MSRFFRMLKFSVLIIFVLSVLLSLASCDDGYDAEYDQKLEELIYRKQKLIDEKNALADGIDDQLGNASYMSFVFVQLNSALYTDVYPIMSEGEVKLVGVMALSADELPGLEGKITLAEYSELIISGWGNALYWNGEGALEDFIVDMQHRLAALDIDLPKSIVFAEDTYSFDCDNVLLAHGIENVVHTGEENLNYIERTEPLGLWRPGRIGWRWIGKSTALKNKIESDCGYALFEIGFDNSESNTRTSFFPIANDEDDADRVTVFSSMVALFKFSVANGKIEVYNIEDTREKTEAYYSQREKIEAANQLRSEEIELEIKEISHLMTQLYNEYH